MTDARHIAGALLDWFGGRDRDVPWREETDPYRIWVCEVMAQQTRMRTVRERLPAFFERFPSIESLAASHPDDLMRAWEGLGYYARARNLRRAAKMLTEKPGGPGLPDTVDELRRLPGVGPYTAGAVASIAFGRPVPAVDGNARRVLSRLFDLERPTAASLEASARALIRAADERIVDRSPSAPHARTSRAGELNQVIMDLGVEVCTPRDPDCPGCPLSAWCLALERDTVALRPPRRPRRTIPHHDVAIAIVRRDDGRLLIQRRPPEGLLGGLWEFPGGKVGDGERPAQAAVRETREETGLQIGIRGSAGRVDHAYSHFRITLHAFHARPVGGRLLERDHPRVWVRRGELSSYAFPAANRKILDDLGTP